MLEERLHVRKSANTCIRKPAYVLYWMQASQRARDNHALSVAVREADTAGLPVLVAFGLTGKYPGANARHFQFLLEGLHGVARTLEERGIGFILRIQDPVEMVCELAERAALLVCDRGYLRHQRQWRWELAERVPCPVLEVEGDVLVPVQMAYGKEAYSAAVLRSRIGSRMGLCDDLPEDRAPVLRCPEMADSLHVLPSEERILEKVGVMGDLSPVPTARGGEEEARRHLDDFIDTRLARYDRDRNDPSLTGQSGLSPYLHFGQISPVRIVREILQSRERSGEVFLEEMVVRRELAFNHAWYNPAYDRWEGLPAWSRKTLEIHSRDPRPYVYDEETLARAGTHDPCWNAAQLELVRTGRMHGYMRMYWGKKILEWSQTPSRAHELALKLNDSLALDGRDPNGYAGVAWCFGKHDRPWTERPVFGMVRYMNQQGLRRKFDMDSYIRRVEKLAPAPCESLWR